MHYIHDKSNNDTVLLALMQGGIIASFTIEQGYIADIQKPVRTTTGNETAIETAKIKKFTGPKKDKL